MDDEIIQLEKLAHWIFIYLVIGSITSLFVGYYILQIHSTNLVNLFGVSLLGYSGSAVAALTSSLNRYATGFERSNGKKEPEQATGETFNRRMARWIIIRPFLGAIVAPIFIFGINILIEDPAKYTETINRIVFTAFMGGLLAKSVLDLIKGLFKNIIPNNQINLTAMSYYLKSWPTDTALVIKV
jgi:hypothetical protein